MEAAYAGRHVAVFEPVPASFVYTHDTVEAPAPVAVLTSKPILIPTPFVEALLSRAGHAAELIVCAVVVVTAMP
mgnify:CR=1 FL=1